MKVRAKKASTTAAKGGRSILQGAYEALAYAHSESDNACVAHVPSTINLETGAVPAREPRAVRRALTLRERVGKLIV